MSDSASQAASPSRPFPYGTFSLEGLQVEETGAPRLPPTLLVPALSEFLSYTAVYLDRYAEAGAQTGQAIVVRGAHGTGKTHALGYALNRVASGALPRGSGVRDVVQLYAKAEDPDLVGLYRTLMPQLQPSRLRDLSLRFTAEIAADSVGDARGDTELAGEVRRGLSESPELLHTMLRQYFLDESEVLRRRDEEIELCTGGSLDFLSAFRWIDSELGDIAYRWFVGRAVEAGEARKLGVSGPISSPKMAQNGLQLLAGMCERSRTALILYFDQYEKLVLDAADELRPEAAGLLHTLVEVLPRQDAMLVLAGNETAWERLPQDLQQRFGYKVIVSRGLELHEAAALVHIYLRPREEALVDRDIPENALYPFTMDALRLLHLYSRGNPRKLLQLCADAFEAAETEGVIDGDAARAAAEKAGEEHVDPQTALATVRRLADAQGFSVAPGAPGGLRLAFNGTDRLLVLLGQSTHYYDEVLDARDYIDLIEELHQSAPRAKPLLLVLGYDSPEVRETLERAGIDVLPYQPETFAHAFGQVLNELRKDGADGLQASPELLLSQLDGLRQELEQLRLERKSDISGLAAQANAVQSYQQREQIAARWQQATTDWVSERRALEGRIREARQSRQVQELEELARLGDQAERQRNIRTRLSWGFVALVPTLVLAAAALGTSLAYRDPFGFALFVVANCAAVGLLIYAYIIFVRGGAWALREQLFRSRTQRELAMPVSSVEDLRRLAYRAATERLRLRFLLNHPHPQFRYVAAVAARSDELRGIGRAFPGERCALVRRAFAQRLGREPDVALEIVHDASDLETRETVYLLEEVISGPWGSDAAELAARESVRMLVAMSENRALMPTVRALVAQLGMSSDACVTDRLTQALSSGIPLSSRAVLMELPSEALRDCARVLSPFQDGGLGTFDELRIIGDVDQAFLGLSHILFLSELGLLVDAE
jgi:hypothetical protein